MAAFRAVAYFVGSLVALAAAQPTITSVSPR